jgi:epsilon-lactone hydrolase
VGAGGVPDPEGPESELEAYALRMRTAMERFFARVPATRSARTRPSDGAPTDGLWVVDDRAWRDPEERDDEVAGTDRVVLHVHGGGYALGSPATHRGLAASLSRVAEAAVHLPAYRLTPEHRFPAAFDDVVATYIWLTDDLGVDPARMAVTGDSAGGGLGLALLAHLRDLGRPLPGCYVGLSPLTDLAGTGASLDELDDIDPWISAAMVRRAARAYAGETPLDDPRVSPLYADLTGLPPMLVHVGGDEVLLDDAIRIVDAARAAGVDASLGRFEGLWHMFQAFPGLPEARFALREIGAFVQRHTTPVTVWSASGDGR